jgi:ribosomal protein S4
LVLPDFSKVFIIEYDALKRDVRQVLMQNNNNNKKTIAYFSKRLKRKELLLFIYEKEF